MSQLALYLFGTPRIELDGAPVHIARRKALALFAYLAVTGRSHSRDALATLLWRENDQSSARAELRRNLYFINRKLGHEWLAADLESVGLNPELEALSGGGLWLDVAEFQEKLKVGAAHNHPARESCAECLPGLAGAVAHYTDHFMAGFSLPDSPGYDEWQFYQREGLRQQLASALARLSSHQATVGEHEAAIAYAQRWLTLDPLHEPAHQHLMMLFAESGQKAAALRQYEVCKRSLATELDIEPAAETEALAAAIRSGELSGRVQPITVSSVPNNLPSQPTPFVGRERELGRLATLLAGDENRLVTIVGPGGMGKTRLALAAAGGELGDQNDAPSRFPQGIYFVSLAPLTEPEQIAPTVAVAMGFHLQGGGRSPQEQILDYLRHKRMLLVLDNFEHLRAPRHAAPAETGEALVAAMLEAAPQVWIIVTSRERLQLRQEQVYPIEGLEFPDWETPEDASEYTAVQLFLQSAQRNQPDFELAGEDLTYLTRICRLVGGMPLALELAAAWIDMLSLQEIAAELQQGLDLLETELQDVPVRHRSMRAALDYSQQRLDEGEQVLFTRLSVFRNGFTRTAAQEVAQANLRQLARLVNKSLLQFDQSGKRYQIHELLRQFSHEKFATSPEAERQTRAGHSRYYLNFLQQREGRLIGREQRITLEEIQAEIDNIRVAWNWSVDQGLWQWVGRALEPLYLFYRMKGRFPEGAAAFARAVDSSRAADKENDKVIRMKALSRLGSFYFSLYDLDAADECLSESLPIAREMNLDGEISFALVHLGATRNYQGRTDDAARFLEEALVYAQKSGDLVRVDAALQMLGAFHTNAKGDYHQGLRYAQESLTLNRGLANQGGIALALNDLGGYSFFLGQYDEAERYCRESAAIFDELGDRMGLGHAVGGLALIAGARGGAELVRAKELIQQSLASCRETGNRGMIAVTLSVLGGVANRLAEYDLAEQAGLEAQTISQETSYREGLMLSETELAVAANGQGNGALARHYFRSVLQRIGSPEGAFTEPLVLLRLASVLATDMNLDLRSDPEDRDERPQNAGKRHALAMATLVMNYPGSRYTDKEEATKLAADLEAALPPEVSAAARQRGLNSSLEEIVAELLGENYRQGDLEGKHG